jgi:hypothetical protein
MPDRASLGSPVVLVVRPRAQSEQTGPRPTARWRSAGQSRADRCVIANRVDRTPLMRFVLRFPIWDVVTAAIPEAHSSPRRPERGGEAADGELVLGSQA